MAYTLLSGKLPFDGTDDTKLESAILEGDLQMNDDVWEGISEGAKNFIRELLNNNPAKRPTAEAALLMPWMASTSEIVVPASEGTQASLNVLRCLEDFATENAVRRAAAAIAVCSQTDLKGEDVQLAENQFQSIDADENGSISEDELTKVLQLELGIPSEKCQWIFKQLDLNGDHEIQRSEFLAAVVGARLLCSSTEIDKAFKCFDFSRDGKIHKMELIGMLGDSFCGKPTNQIFSELDVNGDLVIDFHEFSSMVKTSC